ncbi:MAG: polysaccharide biosynthesis C-terminal domain-containing protein [Oscillospiraceae bacterium]|nr:polysaccharide biosynthesis C-terminal domain-containing protein [Oscillospiraceae bacterium]
MKKQSFLHASLLLTCSALFAKICGALFKLPLTALLGGTGMGYFSCAYGLFLPLYAILVTGLSTAVARPVADFAGQKKFACALKIRHVARILCFIMGLVGTGFAILFAKYFTLKTSGNLEAYPAVLAITPAVLLCCVTAVERGYYEGLCCMTPTAVSQALEAVAKLFCGLCFCKLFLNTPVLKNYSQESMGALGAVLGVTISTLAGYLCMVIKNILHKQENITSHEPTPSSKKILKILIKIMIPSALGALVTNLTSLIDLLTVMRCFQNMLANNITLFYQKACLSQEIPVQEASAFVYGSFMGLSITVFNLVPSLTNMLAKGVLPCTAQAWASGNDKLASYYARQVLLLTGLIAIPASCGIFALAKPILNFLFSGRDSEIAVASSGLQWLAPALLFLCLTFPVFSLLQAIGKEDLPVKIMLSGIIIKLACNLILIPKFCTAGASISTSLCYAVIFILAIICLKKQFHQPLLIIKPFLFQIWGGILCAGSAWVCYDRLSVHIHEKIAFILAILCAVIIYLLVLFLTSQKELYQLIKPKSMAFK